jgi:hypothetical protein
LQPEQFVPRPLHSSHLTVPFPWQVGHSFMVEARSGGSGSLGGAWTVERWVEDRVVCRESLGTGKADEEEEKEEEEEEEGRGKMAGSKADGMGWDGMSKAAPANSTRDFIALPTHTRAPRDSEAGSAPGTQGSSMDRHTGRAAGSARRTTRACTLLQTTTALGYPAPIPAWRNMSMAAVDSAACVFISPLSLAACIRCSSAHATRAGVPEHMDGHRAS